MSENNVFTILNSLNDKKQNYGSNIDVMKEYNKWTVNRGMSLFPESILYSNDMNISYELTDKMEYDYYFHSVRQGKRFSKWPKRLTKSDDFLLVQEIYKYNDKKTEEALKILTNEQLDELRKINEKGGLSHDKSSRKSSRNKT
jgi:hypothetical protein